jgi:hypothetical protein
MTGPAGAEFFVTVHPRFIPNYRALVPLRKPVRRGGGFIETIEDDG